MFLSSVPVLHSRQLCLFNYVENPIKESKVKEKKDVIQHIKVKHELTLIPKISIHPNQVNLYNEVNWQPFRPVRVNEINNQSDKQVKYEHLLESGRTASGQVSKIAKRKISRALDYMLLIANNKTIHNNFTGKNFKFKLAFVTLTLPSAQIHSDNVIKEKCLNSLLVELRKVYKVKNYIWRAEKQKNGNIHFHILVDKFIPFQELKDRWNRIVNKLGYVDRYREEQINWHKNGFRVRENLLKTWPKEKQYQAFLRGSKLQWNSPNSTDIHSIFKIRNIKLYISKYMTKGAKDKNDFSQECDNEVVQEGRIWSCNQELSNIKGCQAEVDNKLSEECNKLLKSENVKIFKDCYFTSIMLNSNVINPSDFPLMFELFSKYLLEVFDFNLQFELNI
jgi:hypothetical protein